MDELGLPVYIAVKLGAYIGWCYQGARLHGHRDRLLLKGTVYGVVRSAMGAILGLWAILMLVNGLYRFTQREILLYVAVYVPVRWVEWSLMAVIMDQEHRTAANLVIGKGAATRLWRVGGIVISCLADIPMMILVGHLPIGRFMC